MATTTMRWKHCDWKFQYFCHSLYPVVYVCTNSPIYIIKFEHANIAYCLQRFHVISLLSMGDSCIFVSPHFFDFFHLFLSLFLFRQIDSFNIIIFRSCLSHITYQLFTISDSESFSLTDCCWKLVPMDFKDFALNAHCALTHCIQLIDMCKMGICNMQAYVWCGSVVLIFKSYVICQINWHI